MRLLVNADDLGSSPKVNDATFALMEQGVVRSATILANAAAFEDAASRARTFSRCSFGVHLNVTHGVPLAPDAGLAPLLDSGGRFAADAIRSLAIRPDVRRAVFREWSRQIERVGREGIKVSHVDSHDHAHLIPSLFGVLKRIQHAYGIYRVRIPPMPFGRVLPVSRLGKALWRSLLKLDGTRSTDFCCSLAEYRNRPAAATSPSNLTAELMVHPGLARYNDETNLLRSAWWAEEMRSHVLIAYNEL